VTAVSRSYVCVLAKTPVAGRVKTRLARAIGAEPASRLAMAFLEDTNALLRSLPWVHPVLALSEGPIALALHGTERWPQGDGDLGARIERTLTRALALAPTALAIGSDTPHLPVELLAGARDALRDHDAVLGPCADGGFYLLGLRDGAHIEPGLLRDLPWSSPETCAHTAARLRDRRLHAAILPSWFDLDELSDLARLRSLLDAGELHAPRTLDVLQTIDLAGC
jgi:uncharacterized protein